MRPLLSLSGQHYRPAQAGHRLYAHQAWDPTLHCSTGHEPEEEPAWAPSRALRASRHSSYYATAGLQAVTQLSQLIALHLSGNHLKLLPEAVGSLKALQWLDLRRNAPPACSKCAAQPRSLESQPQEAQAIGLCYALGRASH